MFYMQILRGTHPIEFRERLAERMHCLIAHPGRNLCDGILLLHQQLCRMGKAPLLVIGGYGCAHHLFKEVGYIGIAVMKDVAHIL